MGPSTAKIVGEIPKSAAGIINIAPNLTIADISWRKAHDKLNSSLLWCMICRFQRIFTRWFILCSQYPEKSWTINAIMIANQIGSSL